MKIERESVKIKTPVVNDIPDKTKVRPGDDAPPVLTIAISDTHSLDKSQTPDSK